MRLHWLGEDLSQLPSEERRAHWPSAADLFAAYPRLAELLAQRGVTEAAAQQVLDQLWEEVASEWG